MNATIKRTTIVSTIALAIIVLSSIVLTGNSTAIAADSTANSMKDKAFAAEISDIFYAEPAKIEFTETSAEVVPEPEPVLEGAHEYYEEPHYTYDYSYTPQNSLANGEYISAADFQQLGVLYDGIWSYTYYSERILPGTGLEIPGRHTDDDGYVCDGDGNICVASNDLPKGTVVPLPIEDGNRTGVVYDSGSGYGNLDIYTSW